MQDRAWLAGKFKSIYFVFLIKIILLVSVMFLIYSGNIIFTRGNGQASVRTVGFGRQQYDHSPNIQFACS
jgi:hypothetical protein